MSGIARPVTEGEDWLCVSAPVRDAISAGRPVVALESTVLAHGLPRPRNLEVGRALEARVRAGGGHPATIAVLGGVAHVGLSEAQLEHVARAEGVEKLSTRDLPVALARRRDGATTVAATAHLAGRAGIQLFATGGIGGVHRGAPPDVSADLMALRDAPVLVVCAGAKSILDLPATREMLETLGVLVLGWRTESFPAFYSRSSGLGVDARVDSAAEVADIWRSHRRAGATGGMLLCVPIPEAHAIPEVEAERMIRVALDEAEAAGITGRDVTPFLLRALAERTVGVTLEANVALLEQNVSVATEVAAAVAAGG